MLLTITDVLNCFLALIISLGVISLLSFFITSNWNLNFFPTLFNLSSEEGLLLESKKLQEQIV